MDYYAATAAAAQQAAVFRASGGCSGGLSAAEGHQRTGPFAHGGGGLRAGRSPGGHEDSAGRGQVRSPQPDLAWRPEIGSANSAQKPDRSSRRSRSEFQTQCAELSPGEASYASRWPELVRDAFQKYEDLTDDYGAVPKTGREIESQVARKRRLPEYAEVLNEPESAALWQLGQEHEQQDHACCAYWVYQEALRLLPAPSAQRAQERLAVLQRDPQLQAAAESCRALQECHKKVPRRRADPGQEPRPSPAASDARSSTKAASDSELYQAASRQLETLPR